MRKKLYHFILHLTLIVLASFVLSQEAKSASVSGALYNPPKSSPSLNVEKQKLLSQKFSLSKNETLHVKLPALPADTLKKLRKIKNEPMQIGTGRELDKLNNVDKVSSSLVWQPLPDGGRLSRAQITSTGAKSIRVGMEVTKIPQDTEFRFFNPNAQDPSKGSVLVTENEINGIIRQNLNADPSNPDARIYWSPSVEGESIGIEIYLPSKYRTTDLQISFPSVSHIYKTSNQITLTPILEPITNWPGPSLTCQNDIQCYSQYTDKKKTVAGMSFVKNGNTHICTGTILNSNPSTWVPYFLTANHCISSQIVASTLETHWLWESSYCNSQYRTSNYKKVSGGAKLLSTFGWNANPILSMDSTLLQLNSMPPAGTWYSGWLTKEPAIGEAVTAIHHPQGDYKKISFATYGSTYGCVPYGSGFSCSSNQNGLFVKTNFYDGAVEPGSSGSGIFNKNGQLVGTLTGGGGSCLDYSNLHIYYSKLNAPYWKGNWAKWLYTVKPMPWMNLLLRNKGTSWWGAGSGLCCNTSSYTFSLTHSGVTKNSSVATCSSSETWEGWQSVTPGNKSFLWTTTSSGCTTYSGSFDYTLEDNVAYWFRIELDQSSSPAVFVYTYPQASSSESVQLTNSISEEKISNSAPSLPEKDKLILTDIIEIDFPSNNLSKSID